MAPAFDTIILAGGLGSRLRGVVGDRPKCLALIHGRPFLSYLLEQLGHVGITDVILSTGYMADQVEQTFQDQYGPIALRYSRESAPLGTGGGVRNALGVCRHSRLLVINGDSFFGLDWPGFLAWFDPARMKLGMALAWIDDCRRYGQVEITDDGEVLGFREKSETASAGWINAGIYLLDRATLAGFAAPEAFSLERDYFPKQIGRGFYAQGNRAPFIDIGTPESYRAAEEFFLRRNN